MVEIAKMMDWTYVSTVAAEGEYGEKGIASFVGLAKKHGICVAVSLKISRCRPGLPDGILSNQKSQFGKIWEGLGMEKVGIFHGHMVYIIAFSFWYLYFTVIW
jgi:metabotropic glutamate receptor 6/7/8